MQIFIYYCSIKMNGMIALRTMFYFITTSLLAACVGLVLVVIVHPGNPEIKAGLGQGKIR